MSNYIISGIQQIGIGVSNVTEGFKWYNQNFGMDVPIFEEAAEANLMLPYTGGKPHQRHAILAINLKGGGVRDLAIHEPNSSTSCFYSSIRRFRFVLC